MINATFEALVIEQVGDKFTRTIQNKNISQLPEGDLLVRVKYSSLNYKDALSASGNRGVTRRYPHTPGIDCAGVVEKCDNGLFSKGDEVLVSGFDLGMNRAGGFGQYIRIPAQWAVHKPEGLTLKECMIWGTAGFTAAQCVHRIVEHGGAPDAGPVLVTGATGGVGCLAVAILAKIGYQVTAVTGKSENDFLSRIGAADIIERCTFVAPANKALLRERWAAVVDTVGGDYLATAIKSTKYNGIVTSCGNAAAGDLPLTVYPFILRGVTLAGIDSANTSVAIREKVWNLIAQKWKLDFLTELATEVTLAELGAKIDLMLVGKLKGRVVVNML